jgi:DNA-binding ferritin-like protein (Dps family)
VGIRDIIEGKKQWRAHMARVKALPRDYQVVYKEIQKYLFKVGQLNSPGGSLLSGIADFFEEGAATGKGVLELIGNDVAAFCDDLVKGSRPATACTRSAARASHPGEYKVRPGTSRRVREHTSLRRRHRGGDH